MDELRGKKLFQRFIPNTLCLTNGCVQKLNTQINTHTCAPAHSGDSCMWAADTCRGGGMTHAQTHWNRERTVWTNSAGATVSPIILDAHAFPHSLSQHTVSMPEWRESVKRVMNEAGNCAGFSACSPSRYILSHSEPKLALTHLRGANVWLKKRFLSQIFFQWWY